jgi:hypothetical protein
MRWSTYGAQAFGMRPLTQVQVFRNVSHVGSCLKGNLVMLRGSADTSRLQGPILMHEAIF